MDGPSITRTPGGRALLGVGVVGVALVVATTAYTGVSFGGERTDRASADFPLTGQSLTIEAPDTAVDVVPGPAGKVSVERTITSGFRTAHPRWELRGSTLTLKTGCPTFMVANCDGHFRVSLPAQTSLKVANGDGSLHVSDLRGALDVNSADGSVSLVGVSGDVRVRSVDGSVRGEDLTSRQVTVDSQDGSVRLAFASAPQQVRVTSADGSARVLVPRVASGYVVDKQTRDGSVGGDVSTTPGAARAVTVHGLDGSVDVSYSD